MNSLIHTLMSLPLIISVVLKITVILGLGWIAHLLLAGYNPRWRILLWRCVIVGIFLIPALIPLKYLQIKIPQPSSEPTEMSISTLSTEPQRTFKATEMPAEFTIDSELVEVEYQYAYAPVQTPFSLSKWLRENLWVVVFSTWAIVTAIFALRLLTGFSLIKRKVQVSTAAPEHIQNLLDKVADELNCPVNVKLHYSAEVLTPFLTGYHRPMIIIPKNMIVHEYNGELPAILAHEIAHLRSRDMFWMFAARLAGILLWFHPLTWKMRDAHNAACEEVCDAVAADYIGNTEEYSSTLASIALNIMGKVMITGGIPMAQSSNILRRIRLLKRKVYSNPLAKRSAILSVLLLMTVFVCVGGVKLAYADSSGPTETQQSERVIHFPEDRSLGQIRIRTVDPEYWVIRYGAPMNGVRWEEYCPAQGEVTIPAGEFVQLALDPWTWENPQNLSVLQQFEADDFYSLAFNVDIFASESGPSDECMPYIAHLTGLKSLSLNSLNITARGLEELSKFESLEQLSLLESIADAGMVHVGKVTTLRTLSISRGLSLANLRNPELSETSEDIITDAGLSQISNLKALESLFLTSDSITDEGLGVLSELPNLKQLTIQGGFTSDAIAYLQDSSSLKYLWVSFPINDQGMKHLAGLTPLEGFRSTNTESENITDEGIEYIKDMPNLRLLFLHDAQLTDRALIALKEISTLEVLEVPGTDFTDNGIKNLTELKNLKRLSISSVSNFDYLALTDESLAYLSELENLEELTLGGTGFTDKGMLDLAKLTKLTQLSFFGGPNLTDEGMQNLAKLQQLRILLLHGNQNITNKTFEAISELENLTRITFFGAGTRFNVEMNANINDDALKLLSNLTSLNDILIYSCPSLTDAGVQHLEGLKLRRCMFYGTNITAETMIQLKENTPGLLYILPSGSTAFGAQMGR